MLRVILTAIAFGIGGLVGGIAVPIMRDPTTVQGPLLGVLITGPLGFVIGGHIGVLWAAYHRRETTIREIPWLLVFAFLTLLLYEFFAVIGAARLAVAPNFALLLTIVSAGLLSANASTFLMRSRLLAIAIAMVLMFVIDLWPPVTANPWYRGFRSPYTNSAHFRSLFSSDLDTRRRVPPLVIDRSLLHLEWAAAAAIGFGCAMVSDRSGAKQS